MHFTFNFCVVLLCFALMELNCTMIRYLFIIRKTYNISKSCDSFDELNGSDESMSFSVLQGDVAKTVECLL